MSYRKGTRAAKKLPLDWDLICEQAFFRLVAMARDNLIPMEVSSSTQYLFRRVDIVLCSSS